ncbi:alpha/beta hydrolase [Pedobacter frigiditerrae]|uniref:Alpha/beta hydrolase n=1 Tax=Pedobacter frigiditerrae TaxID=2530452 RepID=A0A4R0MP05_9SPHI|nr:alpha/beta hydrolase [Pedobacter frigiditerrae]TCC88520.1 alpha/beta hydrolase [Pedobacter frigiditerrae]
MNNLTQTRSSQRLIFVLTCLFAILYIPRLNAQTNFDAKSLKSKTIVFVTGAFVSNECWAEWEQYFKERGYKTIAPAWPNKEGVPSALRQKHPDSAIAALTLTQVVDHYASIISKLPEKPIVMGHSFGGLITQLLVQRNLAEAGIIYHSVAPKGVISTRWSFIKSVTPALGLFTSKDKTYLMTFKQWQYTFTNGMSLQEQQESYDRLVIPESKRAAKGALTKEGKVDFKKPHVPLLFVSGDKDHIIPSSLNRKNFKRYKDKNSITEYKVFAGRNHYSLSQSTWREDADYILDWLSF